MSRWLKNYGFAFLVLTGLVGACYLASTADVPEPVPDFALQAKEIYRLEVGMAFFIAFYLASMAIVLALDGRGFAELGTRGLRAERVVDRATNKHLRGLHHQVKLDRFAKERLDAHEVRLEKLEEKS